MNKFLSLKFDENDLCFDNFPIQKHKEKLSCAVSFQSVAHIAKMKKRKKISGYLFTCIVVKPLRSWVKGGFSNKGQGKNIGFQIKVTKNLCFLGKSGVIFFFKMSL